MSNQIQITKQGFESLKKDLGELMDVKRPKLVERLSYARSQGDLSENSDYQNAKEELEFLDGRISELQGVLKNAVVVDGKSKNGEASIGTKVTLKVNGKEHIYQIVGDWEADPINKKISHTSPLGQALVGKKTGDKVEVEAPAGKITYKILAIE
jgi:transcription elongation factor GreA